jgi:hypothetical protein
MINYERFTLDGIEEHIAIYNENGTRTCFPADESNPNYVQFLNELKQYKEIVTK